MLFNLLFRAIFPTACVNCEEKTENDLALCEKCLKLVSINDSLFCGKCHARLPNSKKICHFNTQFVLAAATNYRLNPPIQKLIRKFKFRHSDWIGKTLAKFTLSYASKVLPRENLIVCPIPLGKKRLRKRGFNQAEIIAKIIAQELRLPILSSALVRVKETEPQTSMHGMGSRDSNLENAFWADEGQIKDKNILLIDDVTTTGATLASASKALRFAGAKKICALVSAKAG